ncbi:MAG TPA: hypothetical protein VFV35_01760 [Acidimicrobiales bacterium]|nr:hypothetical protein [Acidimicrobiales bacterium]
MSLRRETATSLLAVGVSRGLGAAGGIAAARILGPGERGELGVLVAWGSVAGTAATCGMQFWVARQAARGAPFVAVLRLHSIALSSLVAVAVAAVLPFVPGETAVAVGTYTIGWALGLLFLAVLNGSRRFADMARAYAIAGSAYLALVLALGAAGYASPPTVLLAGAAANAIPIWWGARVLRAASRQPSTDRYPDVLRESVPGGVGELLVYVLARADVVVVALFLDAAQVGLYAVAATAAEGLLFLADAVAQVVLPRAARSGSVAFAAAATAAVTGGAATIVAVLARPLVVLVFGEPFAEAAGPLRWLLPGAVAFAVWKVLGAEAAGAGRAVARASSTAVGVGVLLAGLLLVLASGYGLSAAAAAASCGYLASAAVLGVSVRRLRSSAVST